jgi:dolichyl-phosphate-mannose--protein O-mannosyl transferase
MKNKTRKWIGRVSFVSLLLILIYSSFLLLPHWSSASASDRHWFIALVIVMAIITPLFIRKEMTGRNIVNEWRRKNG